MRNPKNPIVIGLEIMLLSSLKRRTTRLMKSNLWTSRWATLTFQMMMMVKVILRMKNLRIQERHML